MGKALRFKSFRSHFEDDRLIAKKLEVCGDPIIVAPADPTLPYGAEFLKRRVFCADLFGRSKAKSEHYSLRIRI